MCAKKITVPKISEAIEITGNFDKPGWKNAAVISPFTQNSGDKSETETTTLRLCYDDTYLYLGWTCKDSDIQATYTKHDADLWDEEVAEFFISPHDPGLYFELQWNPLGTVFDAIITNQLDENGLSKSFQGDRSWHAKNMKHKVVVDGKLNGSAEKDVEWRVEAAIPFADLNEKTPSKSDVWRGNFYRYNRTGKDVEYCAWSPTRLESFHEPSRFGEITFG